jgi:hypothetical protein
MRVGFRPAEGSTDADLGPRAVRQNQKSQRAVRASADRSDGAARGRRRREHLPNHCERLALAIWPRQ